MKRNEILKKSVFLATALVVIKFIVLIISGFMQSEGRDISQTFPNWPFDAGILVMLLIACWCVFAPERS